MTRQALERLSLLKVPLDLLPPGELTEVIYQLLREDGSRGSGGKNIVLLSLRDFLRARRKGEYRDYVSKASLVIPISTGLVGGARFLLGKVPVRYMPFHFVVSLLTILEKRELSLYLLGGSAQALRKAEKNIRQTLPKLRIVGRYTGSFKRQEEKTIVEAIRKAAPSLLLVNKGVRGGELWIARNNDHLGRGLRLWCSDLFSIFAEQRSRPSDVVFDKGLEWVGYCLRNPLRFFRVFPYLYYKCLLLGSKLFKKGL